MTDGTVAGSPSEAVAAPPAAGEARGPALSARHALARERARFHESFCACATIYVVAVQVLSLVAWGHLPSSHYWDTGTAIKFTAFVALYGTLATLFIRFVRARLHLMAARSLLPLDVMLRVSSCFFIAFFFLTFSNAKNLIQYVNGYAWDPFFAELDAALHFGVDPWMVYFPLVPLLGLDAISYWYSEIWGAINFFLPFLILLFERDVFALRRFFLVYAIVWVGLGNALAAIFLSGGPVYYEAMTGNGQRFADFFATMRAHGFEETTVARIQDLLLRFHLDGMAHFGSGISAFPSVHVGIATLIGLYIWSRFGRLGALAMLFPLGTQAFSVVLGWHYAVDGYVAIAVVAIAWHVAGRALARPTRHAHP